ncbi:MAG: hypothetical protein AAFP08_03195 [Bacteroidota bacterium]
MGKQKDELQAGNSGLLKLEQQPTTRISEANHLKDKSVESPKLSTDLGKQKDELQAGNSGLLKLEQHPTTRISEANPQ